MLKFLVWLILLAVCWPLAILALLLYPFVWLLMLPFRLVGVAVGGLLGLIGALFRLPTRLLSGRPDASAPGASASLFGKPGPTQESTE